MKLTVSDSLQCLEYLKDEIFLAYSDRVGKDLSRNEIERQPASSSPTLPISSCSCYIGQAITNMRGFLVSEHAHPSKISLSSDVPEPKPLEGQVLVDVYSAGLNFFDASV